MVYRMEGLSVTDPRAGELRIGGDGYAAAGEVVTLLGNAQVQRYLDLTPQEAAQAGHIADRYRDALRGVYAGARWRPPQLDPATVAARADLKQALQRLLGPARAQRLQRLSWRIRDAEALTEDELADALRLTPAQRQAVASAAQAHEEAQRRVLAELGAARLRDPADLQHRAAQVHRAGQQQLRALLTDEQRQAFERLMADDEPAGSNTKETP